MTSPTATTAERIRSACVRASCAILAVEGVEPTSIPVHHLLDDGSFAITVPGDGILAGMALRRGRVRPLSLDRYGVQLRVESDDGDHDVRLPFAKPVDDITGLSQAIRILMGCPFLNGIRARRL
jgi:hypothetical protein